jgi:hypothetical protein
LFGIMRFAPRGQPRLQFEFNALTRAARPLNGCARTPYRLGNVIRQYFIQGGYAVGPVSLEQAKHFGRQLDLVGLKIEFPVPNPADRLRLLQPRRASAQIRLGLLPHSRLVKPIHGEGQVFRHALQQPHGLVVK